MYLICKILNLTILFFYELILEFVYSFKQDSEHKDYYLNNQSEYFDFKLSFSLLSLYTFNLKESLTLYQLNPVEMTHI